jgi:hypothetical protein
MSLWTEATSYRNAARYLSDGLAAQRLKLPYPHPVLFLVGHSLEVILKANLRARGHTLNQLIEAGHDLLKLADAVETTGAAIPISYTEREHIQLLNALHGMRPFQTRYPITGFARYPDQQLLINVVDRLIELAKPDCLSALS